MARSTPELKEALAKAERLHDRYQRLEAASKDRIEDLHETIAELRDLLTHLRRRLKRAINRENENYEGVLRDRIEALERDLDDAIEHMKHSARKAEHRDHLAHKWHERAETIRERIDSRNPNDKLIGMLVAYGMRVDHAAAVIGEAHDTDLRLAAALALGSQESGHRNVIGCDYGPRSTPPYCGGECTEARAKAVRASGMPNGLGPVQLTSFGYVDEANRAGGVWIMRFNYRIGFRLLAYLFRWGGTHKGYGAYNGGQGNPIDSYADSCEALERTWQARINRALG